MNTVYAVFHMNLAFSAVAPHQRVEVIRNCYHPLLDLVEQTGLPLGIECGGWTLEEIERLAPAWIERFRDLLQQGKCELIGSGYMQIIGPLVPERVNRFNQREGLAVYEQMLGVHPHLALVNEMALSGGLLPGYLEAGYRGLIFERENLELALGEAPEGHCRFQDARGNSLPLLFSDSILFQKFQRVVHGQVPHRDFHDYLRRRLAQHPDPAAVYCSDVEIFGYRPKRYDYEEDRGLPEEWGVVRDLLVKSTETSRFVSPAEALSRVLETGPPRMLQLTSARYPVPVKKQPKYNLARWAVSGRDDLWLNTRCHAYLRQMDPDDRKAGRALLELWSSDLRTHVGDCRFRGAVETLATAKRVLSGDEPPTLHEEPKPPDIELLEDPDGFGLMLASPTLKMVLNRRRGLTITRLAFAAHQFAPVIGTLPHGYFRAISLGADFYSGGVLIETTQPARRITDLERLPYRSGLLADGSFALRVTLHTPLGALIKTISLHPDDDELKLSYHFPGWTRPQGLVRLGNITLLPESFDASNLRLSCHNGGPHAETFHLDAPCRHGAAVSSLVSCTAGLGATEGALTIGDTQRKVALNWDPAQCAAMPMLWHEPSAPAHLTRVIFSLAELDDTRRRGGRLPAFELKIKAVT
ncbi:MAG: hypothetical protein QNK37_18105 [Acidobacteriota bacterium]|nr:hypothetical protein [Acidobacteriota bacterium]